MSGYSSKMHFNRRGSIKKYTIYTITGSAESGSINRDGNKVVQMLTFWHWLPNL